MGDSTWEWIMPIKLTLDAKAQYECGLVSAVVPSMFKECILPKSRIRYKMVGTEEVKFSYCQQTTFVGLDGLISSLNASLTTELIGNVIFMSGSDAHCWLEVKETVEYIEMDGEYLSMLLGFDNITHFEHGRHFGVNTVRVSLFSNQISVYTDFTENRIVSNSVVPLLKSFVLPVSAAEPLETVSFQHIEYMGLSRLDLRNIGISIYHSVDNLPFKWQNPFNHFASFTLHFRRANLLFDSL